jgi:glycosyltransferase involved in cell wall biosynthesis
LRTTFQVADRQGFDVLHLLYFDRTQIPLRLATLRGPPDVPVVATLHRDAFLSTADSGLPARAVGYATARAIDSTLDDGALGVLTVHADAIRDRIVRAVPAATTENVRTIPAPTPEPAVSDDTAGLRADLDLPVERDLLLFFGGLRHEKGPDVLADHLRDVDRPLTVVFAGSPVDFSPADVEAWRHDAGDAVDIIDRLEYIPEEDVDRYFAAVDATVLPYRRTRGISGPLRRSAMVGTPVVATAGTDVGRLVERHGLGATFDPDDRTTFVGALAQSLDDGAALRESLEAFAASRHWERTGEVLVGIYEEVSEG